MMRQKYSSKLAELIQMMLREDVRTRADWTYLKTWMKVNERIIDVAPCIFWSIWNLIAHSHILAIAINFLNFLSVPRHGNQGYLLRINNNRDLSLPVLVHFLNFIQVLEVMLTEGASEESHVCGFAGVQVCSYLNSFKMIIPVTALSAIEFLCCSCEACNRQIH